MAGLFPGLTRTGPIGSPRNEGASGFRDISGTSGIAARVNISPTGIISIKAEGLINEDRANARFGEKKDRSGPDRLRAILPEDQSFWQTRNWIYGAGVTSVTAGGTGEGSIMMPVPVSPAIAFVLGVEPFSYDATPTVAAMVELAV